LREGDAFVLWSEEAVDLYSAHEERALVAKAQAVVLENGLRSFLGLTYILNDNNVKTNRFTLVAPDGSVAWIYEKAFPVPVVEGDITPGPATLPVFESEKFGKLSGAICFDLDYPDFIRGKLMQ